MIEPLYEGYFGRIVIVKDDGDSRKVWVRLLRPLLAPDGKIQMCREFVICRKHIEFSLLVIIKMKIKELMKKIDNLLK